MKKTICNLIWVLLFGSFVFCPAMAVAHGGGGGGDGGGGDAADAYSNSSEDYLMGGGVSWFPNPNGSATGGSSVYDGRKENIEKGPYQSGWSVEDAEAYLLHGWTDKDGNHGSYTPEFVLEQLEWAEGVGIKLSAEAVLLLHPEDNSKSSSTQSNLTEEDDNSKSSSMQSNLTEEDDNFLFEMLLFEAYDLIAMAEYIKEQRKKDNNSKSSSTKTNLTKKDKNKKKTDKTWKEIGNDFKQKFKDEWKRASKSGGTITFARGIKMLQEVPIQKK